MPVADLAPDQTHEGAAQADERFMQMNRFMAVHTPLGPDKLLLKSFTGQEAMSELFRFRLELLSEDRDIPLADLVGQNVTWAVRTADDKDVRYFNGFVSRFSFVPEESRFARYDAEVVPWLWFLTRTSDCRVFLDMTSQEIIEKVFADFGFTDFEFQLTGKYFKREMCVQYRETAANFVMRLLEDEGIAFFWKHENGRHVMVMFDSPAAYIPCQDRERVEFERDGGTAMARDIERVHSWRMEAEFRPGRYALNDFNFETPLDPLLVQTETMVKVGGNKAYELYDYPGEYRDIPEGDEQVRIRMEEEETPYTVVTAAADVRAFSPGHKFELYNHPREDQNAGYVVLRIRHDAHEGGTYTGTEGAGAMYSNTLSLLPEDVRFRPPRLTPKPIIQGSQTALVVGPKGEEIFTEKYGRVKLHFWWDRYGHRDGSDDSCWIRVAQIWAGKQWGAMWLPRIGQEVQVDFLEGDPDRPVVTGRLYNADQLVPYPLPDEQTKSTIKSCSVGGAGFNEIRFEDKAGEEQIFVHAQLDADLRVLRDCRELIERDRHEIIKGNRNERIDGAWTVKVAGEVVIKSDTKIILDAPEISINGAGGFVKVTGQVDIEGKPVNINCGASKGNGSVRDPAEADDAEPGEVSAGDAGGPLDNDPGGKTEQAKTLGANHYILADIAEDDPRVLAAAHGMAPAIAENLANAMKTFSPDEMANLLKELPTMLGNPGSFMSIATETLGAPGLAAMMAKIPDELANAVMGPLQKILAADGMLMEMIQKAAGDANAALADAANNVLDKLKLPEPLNDAAKKALADGTKAIGEATDKAIAAIPKPKLPGF